MIDRGRPWRTGDHFAIHVYAGDVPVATFHKSLDAASAVQAHNEAIRSIVPSEGMLAIAAIERVKALHERSTKSTLRTMAGNTPLDWCLHDGDTWPCETIQALDQP